MSFYAKGWHSRDPYEPSALRSALHHPATHHTPPENIGLTQYACGAHCSSDSNRASQPVVGSGRGGSGSCSGRWQAQQQGRGSGARRLL